MRRNVPRRQVGSPAFITQNGAELNLLNEVGEASRAWPDWFAPATRIRIERYNYGAVYSPDGVLIQFDNGTIWHGDLGLPPPSRSSKKRAGNCAFAEILKQQNLQ
jgi:hypothetical protein